MIKDLSVLSAGPVLEGDGIGFDGIPANDRWYDNDRLSMALDIAREAAVFLDDLGFDILWMPSTTSSGRATSASPTC